MGNLVDNVGRFIFETTVQYSNITIVTINDIEIQ